MVRPLIKPDVAVSADWRSLMSLPWVICVDCRFSISVPYVVTVVSSSPCLVYSVVMELAWLATSDSRVPTLPETVLSTPC